MNKDIKYIYDYLKSLTSLSKKVEKEVKELGKSKEDIASLKATVKEMKDTIKEVKKIDVTKDIANISLELINKMAKYTIKDGYWYVGNKKLDRATGYSITGSKGQPGKDGTNGVDGKDGLKGKDGKHGLNGRNGTDGKKGQDGKSGTDGKDAPMNNITIGKVKQIGPGDEPEVKVRKTKDGIVLDFFINRGVTGARGATGKGIASGGTTDQVLAKASATDYDTKWVTDSGGSVTKITQNLTLTATNIANKYVDLANTPQDNTAVGVFPVVGIKQLYTTDFTVITDGTTIKRLNWNGLTLETLLSEGDILSVDYIY